MMAGKSRPSLRAKTLQNVATSNLSMTDKKCIESVFAKFESLSKADVVEVVRCGKCKHGEVSIMSKSKDGEEEMACYCNAKNKVTDLEYYCACGERGDT
jgi:formylmethanofuran dehydrogenase subunit E